MATPPTCNCIDCVSPASVACNCFPSLVLLCQEHIHQHIEDLPAKVHEFQDLYLGLQPQEHEALLLAQTFLLNTEKAKKERLAIEFSHNTGEILKDLEETTKRLLERLKDTNQLHFKRLKELTKNMSEMSGALSEIGRLGVPTFKRQGLSVRLEALKRNNQIFSYLDILREIKTCWEQQGMTPLSQLIYTQDQPAQQYIQITDQMHFTLIREHQVTGGDDFSFSLDGRYYAAGGDDKTVKIWDAVNGELLHSFAGHTDQVFSVSFSPDSESLISGSLDKTIRLWRVSNGQEIKQLQGHSHWVFSVVFSNNGELIASGSADNTVKLWKARGDLLHSFQGHSNYVYSVCFSHDDRLLASGSEDSTIMLWDVSGLGLKGTLSSHSGDVRSVCFARDSLLLVSGSNDKTVKLWNVDSGELIHTFQGHSLFVYSVVFSPDNKFIASGSGDETIKLWRVATKSLITTLKHSSQVVGVKFSPDGLILASRDRTGLELISLMFW